MISIITINYNGLAVTSELLDSLLEVGFIESGGEVIVVDNASRVDEIEILKANYPWIVGIGSDVNLGFAGGNNLGIACAKGDLIMFLNNDTVVRENFTDTIENFFVSHPQCGALSPKILFYDSPTIIQFAGYTKLSPIMLRNHELGYRCVDGPQFDQAHLTPYAHGAAMVVRSDVIDLVGMMPSCYFLYYEELDWSLSIYKAKYEIWYLPSVRIYHKESWTTGKQSPLKVYYTTRNRFKFTLRNLTGFRKWISIVYQMTVSLLMRNFIRVLDGRFDLVRASFRSVVDMRKCGREYN